MIEATTFPVPPGCFIASWSDFYWTIGMIAVASAFVGAAAMYRYMHMQYDFGAGE